MILSESGQIANEMWFDLPKHFQSVSLDEFVVMPNHVHGIIIVEPSNTVRTLDVGMLDVGTLDVGTLDVGMLDVGTLHATSLRHTKNKFMSSISPKPGSLPAIIRSYKSAVSKTVHLTNPDFSWQPRYYDHLIRSDQEMFRIKQYIINNPRKWENK
jgi:REP element-mobilizing transposase RayT